MNTKTTITHFIPLIGPFELARRKINKEEPNLNLEATYKFSFSPFKNNEQHINHNFKEFKINYLDESSEAIAEQIKSNFGTPINTAYRDYIKANNILPTDLQLSVPPCAGLSMLNVGNRGSDAAANGWMYESVKWFVAQGSKVLLLENAPGLLGKFGLEVLENIKNILKELGVENEYKFHLTKTTTTSHGIPQHRGRAFLYLYKKDKRYVFKNIKHTFTPLEQYLDKYPEFPNEEYTKEKHFEPIEGKYSQWSLDFINKHNIWDELRQKVKDKAATQKNGFGAIITTMPTMVEMYEKDNTVFEGLPPKLEKGVQHAIKKVADGKGYWDASPIFATGKVNAVISKNSFRQIHPKYNRYLTIRELMSLMGYPDDYMLIDAQKNFNHICQSLPVNTGADHIRWAIGIAKDNTKYATPLKDDVTDNLFMQNNISGNLENELFTSDFALPWNPVKIAKGTSLKTFFG